MDVYVFRRDNCNVNDKMVQDVKAVGQKMFGDVEVYVGIKLYTALTPHVTFSIPDTTAPAKIVEFIMGISHINPLYSVRLEEDDEDCD